MAPPEINWTQEWFRILGTGGIAYLAFLFANRGRKYDVLHKERYNCFKAISNQLLEMRQSSQRISGSAERIINKMMSQDGVSEYDYLNGVVEDISSLIPEIDKTKINWMFLKPATRQMVEEIIVESGRLILYVSYFHTQSTTQEAELRAADMKIIEVSVEEMQRRAKTLSRNIEIAIDQAYKELGLPDYRPIFEEKEETHFIILPETLEP